MDTQRLILFVIFSFSALFLWEAWQQEHASAAAAAGRAATTAGAGDAPAGLPHGRAAVPAAPAPRRRGAPARRPAPTGAPVAPRGRTVTISTDLYTRGDRHRSAA